MSVLFFAEEIDFPPVKRRKIAQWVKQVASGYSKKIGEINYIFCTDNRILEINCQYLQHDYFTDIITFDYSESNILSGDMFISLETIKSNSEKFGTTYHDELLRVIIHGFLHLCGENDKSPKEREIMSQKEDVALALLNETKTKKEKQIK